MKNGKTSYVAILFLFVWTCFVSHAFAVKSVYVISKTGQLDSTAFMKAYRVNGNSLIPQTQYNFKINFAIGLAIDPCSKVVFSTHECFPLGGIVGNIIELTDAKRMQYIGKTEAIGAENLAGITFDKSKNKLYAVDRGTNKFYSWSWDSENMNLTPDFEFPY